MSAAVLFIGDRAGAGDADGPPADPVPPRVRPAAALGVAVRVATAVWTAAIVVLLGGLLAVKAAGWRIEAIASASMAPAIPKGAAALVAPVGDGGIAGLQVGDVILFRHPQAERLVMHRIVTVIEQDGTRFFETKGDANDSPDARLVPQSDVESRVRGSMPRVGALLTKLEPPGGLLWLGVLPWLVLSLLGHLARRRSGGPGGRNDGRERE